MSVQQHDRLGVTHADELVRKWFSGGQAADHQGDSLALSLADALQIARENRWWILLLMVLGCLAGSIKAISETPVYRASLTMAVEPRSVASSSQTLFDPYAFRFYETQYELIKSRSVAQRVVEQLNLVERSSIHQLLVPPSMIKSLINMFESVTGVEFTRKQPEQTLTNEDKLGKAQWLTAIIQSGVEVSGGEKTNLVKVTYDSIDPDFAAEIANALVEAYIDQGLDSQLNRSQQTTQWLSQRIEDLKQSLDNAEATLQKFLLEEDMLGSGRSNQITTSELQSLNTEYVAAQARLGELQKRYGSRHPKVSEAQAEVVSSKARLDRRSRQIASSREKQVELDRLEREVQSNKELYEAFLTKFKEADLSSSGSQVASARIIDRALPPRAPIHPQKQRIVLMWTLGGLFLGFGLAFLREQLDTTFKNGYQVESKLALPLFGVLQTADKSVSGVERHYIENTRSVFSESINHIRTGLMYSNVDNPPKVIVITSSVQSEGKTTLASNLALSYAQMGKTLLVDADLRRPRIKHIIANGVKTGLVDYVAGAASFDDCVKQDQRQENLFILNSGTAPPNPLELLASKRLRDLLNELRDQFDHIIVDTAPVLPASDAVVLGQSCDALLLAIQSDRTTHHMARDAIKRLTASKVHVTGLVLTQANIKKGNPYQYGGYYGYGAYAYVEDKPTKKRLA